MTALSRAISALCLAAWLTAPAAGQGEPKAAAPEDAVVLSSGREMRISFVLADATSYEGILVSLPEGTEAAALACAPGCRARRVDAGSFALTTARADSGPASRSGLSIDLLGLAGLPPAEITVEATVSGRPLRRRIPVRRQPERRDEPSYLPPVVVAGETITVAVPTERHRDARLLTANKGVERPIAENGPLLRFRVPDWMAEGAMLRLAYPDDRGQMQTQPMEARVTRTALPGEPAARQAPVAPLGGVFCLSGDFADAASHRSFLLDGRTEVQVVAESRRGIVLRVPDVEPGGHRLEGPGGFRTTLGVVTIEQRLRRNPGGLGYLWSATVVGTAERLHLRLGGAAWAVALDGPRYMLTSGGPDNRVVSRLPYLWSGLESPAVEIVEACDIEVQTPKARPESRTVPTGIPADAAKLPHDKQHEIDEARIDIIRGTSTNMQRDLERAFVRFSQRREDLSRFRFPAESYYLGRELLKLTSDTRDDILDAIPYGDQLDALRRFAQEQLDDVIAEIRRIEAEADETGSLPPRGASVVLPARSAGGSNRDLFRDLVPSTRSEPLLAAVEKLLRQLIHVSGALKVNLCIVSEPPSANVTMHPRSAKGLTYTTSTNAYFPEPLWVGRYDYTVERDGHKTVRSSLDLIDQIPRALLCRLVEASRPGDALVCQPAGEEVEKSCPTLR